MKRSLLDYFQTYAKIQPREQRKRQLYQKIIRQTVQQSYLTGRMRRSMIQYATMISALGILFVGGFLFQAYFSPGSSSIPTTTQTFASEIANIVSVEGYFEIISSGKRTISPVIRTNDIVSLDEGSSIVMQVGDAFDVVIAGPAKVLVRINPESKKYRLSVLEGNDVSVVSRISSSPVSSNLVGSGDIASEADGIEIEMRDGSIISPQKTISTEKNIQTDSFRITSQNNTARIVNEGTSSVTVIKKSSESTPASTQTQESIVIASQKDLAITTEPSQRLAMDQETQEILQAILGDDSLLVRDDGVDIVLATDQASGSVTSPSLTRNTASGSIASGISSVVITDDASKTFDEVLKDVEQKKPTRTAQQQSVIDVWGDAQDNQTKTHNLVLAYLHGDEKGLDFPQQSLYTQIMKTYSALDIVYPSTQYGWVNTVQSLILLEKIVKKTPGIDPIVTHNIGATLLWLRRAQAQGYGSSTGDVSDQQILSTLVFDEGNTRFQWKNIR